MSIRLEPWLEKALRFYKTLGFFQHLQGETDALVRALHKSLLASSAEPITSEDLGSPEFDLFFLSLDPTRVLYAVMDFGDFLAPGNDAYLTSLEALADISRGVFQPENVQEVWETPEGPILIRFDFQGQKRELKVETWGGAFDFRILLQLNKLLAKTEYRFEMAPMDDILFVTVLKAEERSLLERERDLAFMVLNLPRMFHPLHQLSEPLAFPLDPEDRTFYVGTLNEGLDRCVGRLRFILKGDMLEGHHQYFGVTHKEDFTFEGELDKVTARAEGTIEGTITLEEEIHVYEGVWSGQWSQGNRVATGEWEGWFAKDRADNEERPTDPNQISSGQWAVLEEEFSLSSHPYIKRIRAWLEVVWKSRSSEDYPWLLTQEES